MQLFHVLMLDLTDTTSEVDIIHENLELKEAERIARSLRIEHGLSAIISVEPSRKETRSMQMWTS